MNIISALLRTVGRQPAAHAIIESDRVLDWAAFADRAVRFAGAYRALGVRRGDVVGILSYTDAAMFEAFYGVPWAGGVVCPLNYRLSEAELAEVIEDAGIATLLVDDAFAAVGQALRRRLPGLRNVIHTGAGSPPVGMIDHDALLSAHTALAPATYHAEDVACLYYSGGTTGRAKGVMLTHGNVVANARHVAVATGLGERDRVLHCGPLFHVAGGSRVFNACTVGAGNVLMPRFDAGEVLANIERHRITFVALVPTMIDAILRHPDFSARDTSSLRMILYGAAPIAPTLLERVIATFPHVQLCQAYGQTETAPVATVLAPRHHRLAGAHAGRLRSAGQPVAGVEVRVVDAGDRDVATGAVGEVIVRGPSVMKGYLNQPELTAAALRGGWMHTGDLGRLDADGFLYIVDRMKDMIISGGENVYSAEVENAILSHPDVVECAVFGVPDARWGERVHAVVVPRAGAAVEAALIVEHCRARIGGFKLPRSVDVRTEPLPLSSVGKILKTVLRADHDAAARATAAAAVPASF